MHKCYEINKVLVFLCTVMNYIAVVLSYVNKSRGDKKFVKHYAFPHAFIYLLVEKISNHQI